MLYGRKEYRNGIREAINDVMKDEDDSIVIFAGTVGSISRGIATYNSDYDIKCLFIRKNLQEKDLHCEKVIRRRKFIKDKDYNCIAFWDVYAFLNFLAEPYIDSGNKYDLIHNTYWLLSTPYAWDPLGLQGKLYYNLQKCMDSDNEKLYHFKIMERIFKERVYTQREALRLMHAMLSIQWIEDKKTIPPVNIIGMIEQMDLENKQVFSNLIEKLNCANSKGELIPNDDVDLFKIQQLASNSFERLILNGYNTKDYDFKCYNRNSKIVDRMIETVNLSYNCLPQIEQEEYLRAEDICRI